MRLAAEIIAAIISLAEVSGPLGADGDALMSLPWFDGCAAPAAFPTLEPLPEGRTSALAAPAALFAFDTAPLALLAFDTLATSAVATPALVRADAPRSAADGACELI